MASAAVQVQYVTPEEYLRLERASEVRHEYFNGQIYAMAGGTDDHGTISGNVFALLWNQLRGRNCKANGSDLRLHVSESGLYTYPDVSVLCGETEFDDPEHDTVLNPRVVVEVLSPSTERYDRGDKFAHYQMLPSLTDYLLISQGKPRIEHFVRRGEQWVLTTTVDPAATIRIVSIQCDLKLSEVYERIEFALVPPPGHP